MSSALASRLTMLLETVAKPGTTEFWTPKDLVAAVNARGEVPLSYSYFIALKNGTKANPGQDVLRAIAAEFGVRPSVLLDDDGLSADLPDGLADLGLDSDQMQILARVARALAAENRSGRLAPGVQLLSLGAEPPTADDVYAGSEAARHLGSAAGSLRQLGSDELAELLEGIAASIDAHFAMSAAAERARRSGR